MNRVTGTFTVGEDNTMGGVKHALFSVANTTYVSSFGLGLAAHVAKLKSRASACINNIKSSQRRSCAALLLCVGVLLVPLQSQAQSITYGGLGFTENPANDGSVNGSITASLSGDSYLTPLDVNTDVTLGNIPDGLVPSLSVEPGTANWAAQAAAAANQWSSVTYGNGQFVAVAEDGTNRVMTASADAVATLTLSGNANNHANTNDVSDITFDFADSAFSVAGPAPGITNATGPASSTLGVNFDDPNLVNLSVSAATGAEVDGTVITLTATASRAVVGNQTVNITTTGTAIAGADYLLSNTTITILDGQTSGSVTFTVQNDANIEGLETATLTLDSPSIAVMLGSTISQDIAITDNPDADNDTIPNDVDNCPNQANADQADLDNDDIGDVCDSDADNDQVTSATDVDDLDPLVCLDTDLDSCDDCSSSTFAPNDDGLDTDGDGLCDVGDLDDDNDDILDDNDNCPLIQNQDQNPSVCDDGFCFPVQINAKRAALICL